LIYADEGLDLVHRTAANKLDDGLLHTSERKVHFSPVTGDEPGFPENEKLPNAFQEERNETAGSIVHNLSNGFSMFPSHGKKNSSLSQQSRLENAHNRNFCFRNELCNIYYPSSEHDISTSNAESLWILMEKCYRSDDLDSSVLVSFLYLIFYLLIKFSNRLFKSYFN